MRRIGATGLGLAIALVFATPVFAQCTHCVIQTKMPSASVPNTFDYRVSCIVDIRAAMR